MFFVIGIDPENGHKYTEKVNTIDEATFIKDRLGDVGITEVYITKPVDVEVEEHNLYCSEEFSKNMECIAKELSGYASMGKI